jgi:ankyrin repeat protein
MFGILLEQGLDANTKDASGHSLLHYAIEFQNLKGADLLLKYGADVNFRNPNFQTPVMMAVRSDYLKMVQKMVEYGADLNQWDHKGNTALHLAVRRRNGPISKYLLEHGADETIINFSNMAPIHLAAYMGQLELVKMFLVYDPEMIALEDHIQRTAFNHALRGYKYGTARWLLDHGANIDRVMEHGRTALHLALISRDYDVAQFLIEEGANVRIEDDEKETALFFMRKKKIEYLIDLVKARDVSQKIETNEVESVVSGVLH